MKNIISWNAGVPPWTSVEIHTGIINMDGNVFSVQFVCVFSLHFDLALSGPSGFLTKTHICYIVANLLQYKNGCSFLDLLKNHEH